MATDGKVERTTVRTYVPAHQKDRWQDHADELGMSLSEFVRTMVQAGRTDFEVPDPPGATDGADPPASPDATPGGNGLETRIVEVLATDGPLTWDELVAGLTEDVEDRMDEALAELQRENRVAHSGREGGYTLLDDE